MECAGTAADALELLQSWEPDVLICDISLPDLDGCAFLTELRSREGRTTIPALALTVLGRPGEQERVTAAGFDVFRQKPIDPVDLAHEVGRLAGRRETAVTSEARRGSDSGVIPRRADDAGSPADGAISMQPQGIPR